MPHTPGWNPDKQARVAREASNQGQLDGALPLITSGGAPVVTTFDYPNPSFAAVVAQNRIARTSTDQGQFDGPLPIISKGGAPSVTNFDEPNPSFAAVLAQNRAARTATDQGQYNPLLPELLGKDAMLGAAGQVQDYQQQQAVPIGRRPGLDLLTQADGSEFWMLIDAMAVGAQSTELAPRAAARARDYSITAAFPLALIGQDAMAAGDQFAELPPRAPLRARDYTFVQSGAQSLLLKDAVNPGIQLSGPAPTGPRRASTLTEPGSNQIPLLTSAAPVIPQGQSTGTSDLPPRGPARARDYSIGAGFPLELLGKDQLFGAAGQVPAYDWSYQPPKPRYQQGTGEPQQDLLSTLLAAVAAPPLPPGEQAFDLGPRGPLRARDYTWLQAFALAVFQQLPPGESTEPSSNSPRGPARARDYTLGAGFPLELIGRDAMLVGVQITELAPRAAARLREYSHLATYALANTTPTRDLVVTVGSPEHPWRVGQPGSPWSTGIAEHKWQTRLPQE